MRILVLLVALALAGCTAPNQRDAMDGMDHMDEAQGYSLTATGVPEHATVGEAFSFDLMITGPAGETDHIGGHFWNSTVPAPDTGSAEDKTHRKNCQHTVGHLPGHFTVTCTMDEEGAHTLYGHMAYTQGETVTNFWTHAYTIEVAPIDAM